MGTCSGVRVWNEYLDPRWQDRIYRDDFGRGWRVASSAARGQFSDRRIARTTERQ
jgi:hypothetical protein